MTKFNPNHPLVLAFKDWDKIRPTAECLHCHGTGKAPGDGRTECGFCFGRENSQDRPVAVSGAPGTLRIAFERPDGSTYGVVER